MKRRLSNVNTANMFSNPPNLYLRRYLRTTTLASSPGPREILEEFPWSDIGYRTLQFRLSNVVMVLVGLAGRSRKF